MFGEFFRFELRYQLRTPLLWICTVALAALAMTAIATDLVTVGSAIGNVHRNAPSVIVSFLGTFSALGLFVVVSFVASGLLRDHELGTAELFFATPMTKRDYLFGRMAGGLCACLVIFLGIAVGMSVGQTLPGVEAERLGPYPLSAYGWGFAVIVIPNLLFMTALMGLLAATTRSLLVTYLGVIGFFVLWAISGSITRDLDNIWLATLADPFGLRALSRTMRYWSADERNNSLPALSGYLLANRGLWLAVAIALLAATYARFQPMRSGSGSAAKGKAAPSAAPVPSAPTTTARVAPAAVPRFDRGARFIQLVHLARGETAAVLGGIPFRVMLAFGVMNLIGSAFFSDVVFGTRVYPVTHLMLDAMSGSYTFLLWIILTFYAGELVFRERAAKLGEVVDATPIPNGLPLVAKYVALLAVVGCFLAIGAVASMLFQLGRGYHFLEPRVYLESLALDAWVFALYAALALAVQVFCNNKFLGYAVVIGIVILQGALPVLHLEHNLLAFGSSPPAPYSDMNGFGHFLTGKLWFDLHWTLLATILLLLAALFWVRGSDPSRQDRRREAGRRLTALPRALLAVAVLAFAASNAWIYYNTCVLNDYASGKARLDDQADYEKAYAKYADLPQPRITAVSADVDLHPHERRAEIRARWHLVNKTGQPIGAFHLTLPAGVKVDRLDFAPHQDTLIDDRLQYRIYTLDTPMAPGAEMDMALNLHLAATGFGNDLGSTAVIDNGSFFNSAQVFPSFGYQPRFEIDDRNERRKRGLGEPRRMPKLEDEAARGNTYISRDADWIDFETTVSTDPDQIALAPGYLIREWNDNGRRYFHYRMDRPMLPFFAYLSARWEVRRDRWHDIPIEVYYDAKHPYNVDRMIAGVKDTLDYTAANFTPYQHRQVRIIEFPRYERFAQSFANTIPFSESIGFIADLRDPEKVDYVYYVTAHEIAHQWWAHQVIGANMQGATVMSESLAQYTAQQVMAHHYGPTQMRKFLKYELDNYLASRGGERVEELPLLRVENQPYIHYRKGSLVFYRLADEIGEANVNRALKRYLEDKGYQPPPYTTSKELLDYLRAEAPAAKQALITDLFEKIAFYDDRVTSATATKRPDGKYELRIGVHVDKVYADGKGVETPGTLDDDIEIGAFARAPDAGESTEKVLALTRQHFDARGDSTVTLTVDELPYEVGIDPYNKFIDRVSTDNRKRVTEAP